MKKESKNTFDPGGAGQNKDLIGRTLADDWQLRPLTRPSGPGKASIPAIADFMATYIPDMRLERKLTVLCGDKAVVVSKVTGTVRGPPPPRISILQSVLGFEPQQEVPFFPGIPASAVSGKKFETIAIDVQRVRDDKITQSWHLTDWASAADQLVNNRPPPDFGFSPDYARF